MKLIEPLVAGIGVAAVGTAVLNRRGTATRANYYKDFEASQVYSTQPITLDSSGSAVVYVNQLVDVLVYDSSGTLVREFVAGDSATAVEVISQSFTGTSYSDGSSGASKPTTLAAVLDLWLGSAGAADFKVIPSGTSTPVTIAVATAALAGLFFNVKSYGAIGNGAADDGSAIQAAMNAAAAATNGGGTVFFPPGTYRSTVGLSLAGGSKMLGAGAGTSTKLMFDAASAGLTLLGGVSTQTVLDSMYISCQTTVNSATQIDMINPGRLHMQDCTIGGDAPVAGIGLSAGGLTTGELTIHRCRFVSNSGTAAQIQVSVALTPARFTDCDFINLQANAITHLAIADGASVRGCRFSAANASALATQYINYGGFAPGSLAQTSEVIGNFFSSANAGVIPTALYNAMAIPSRDLIEYGNTFGASATMSSGAIVPYAYATDGYASVAVSTVGYHGSRSQMRQTSGASTPLQCNPKICGETVINWTVGAALTLQTTLGSMGDVWLLYVINTSGGLLTVTPSAQMILDAAAATFTVANNGTKKLAFAWVPTLAGVGLWQQMSPSATS